MATFTVDAAIDGRRVEITFPPCVTEGAMLDLQEYVQMKKPNACPVVAGNTLKILLIREPQSFQEEEMVMKGVQMMIDCWLKCYSKAVWESFQGPARLRLVPA